MTDSYFGSWRNVDLEANAASTWARLSAAKTGAEIHWSAGGCPESGREVSPESEPFVRQYERC
ncbi:hypothetical protein ACFXO7_15995 [Nocardia tengchongensis]